MDFSQVKSIQIPEGNVKQIDIDGVTVWKKHNYFDDITWTKGGNTFNFTYNDVTYKCISPSGYNNPAKSYPASTQWIAHVFSCNLQPNIQYRISVTGINQSNYANVWYNGRVYMPFKYEDGTSCMFQCNGNPNIYNCFGDWGQNTSPLTTKTIEFTPTKRVVEGCLCLLDASYPTVRIIYDSIKIEEV